MQLFTSGSGAMWVESGIAAATILDPEQSQVADDVGFAVVPAGEAGSRPYAYGWIMSIPPNAPNRDAAWLFIQWATSPEMCLDALLAGVPSPRASAWESEEFAENDPNPELTQAMIASLAVATGRMNPDIVNVQPWRDIVGEVVIISIEGGDVEAAALEAQVQLEELVAEEREQFGE
jgi:multiple sugar transport system substrate-binding protein